jgi:histone H3/H4
LLTDNNNGRKDDNLEGSVREVDRAARRAAHQQAYEEKQQAKAIKASRNAVEQYQTLLSSVTSLHKDC